MYIFNIFHIFHISSPPLNYTRIDYITLINLFVTIVLLTVYTLYLLSSLVYSNQLDRDIWISGVCQQERIFINKHKLARVQVCVELFARVCYNI